MHALKLTFIQMCITLYKAHTIYKQILTTVSILIKVWNYHQEWMKLKKKRACWSKTEESDMWHDQGEWVGCQEYWFWDTGLKRWQILMFYIVFDLQIIVHISATICLIEMEFGSNLFNILNGLVIYIEKPKLNIVDMWLIPLDQCHIYVGDILISEGLLLTEV